MENMIIRKSIKAYGKDLIVACDGKCSKAWGLNGGRPKINFDANNPDDYAYFADHESGNAPLNPGTYEGGCGKPQAEEDRLNKWCLRECERSQTFEIGEEIILHDFSKRLYNMPSREKIQNA